MHLLRAFVRRYPFQSIFLVMALLLSGVASGVGLSSLLPALQLILTPTTGEVAKDPFAHNVLQFLTDVGITPTVATLLAIIMAAILTKNALIFLAEQRIGYISADVATDLRTSLLTAVIASRWSFFTGQSTGALANAMATEAQRGAQAYVFAVRVFASFIEATVYTAFALRVSWQATLLCFVAGVFVLSASHAFVRISRRSGERQTHWYRSLLATLSDVLASVKTFKAMGRDQVAEEVLSQETRELRRALRLQVFAEAGLDGAQESLLALVIVSGIYLAFVAFGVPAATIVFMALVLGQTLRRFGQVQKQYQKMLGCESAYWSLERTIAAAKAEAEHTSGTEAVTLTNGVEFDSVSFKYGDHRVLDRVSFTIPAGAITCLVGDSGSGKTTIADLLIGLMRPESGTIRIDGHDLTSLDARRWRRSIGYVPQENLLLNDTILHNVTLGEPALSRAEAEAALRAAGASDFIARLPNGIDSIVGERGTMLSGGQRQRIMIARALAHRPALLILDEATSALDPATEAGICATLRALRGQLTILAVSHQPAMAEIADAVYRLDGGVLVRGAARPDAARLNQLVSGS